MDTNTQTNIQQTLFSGDNELMKIDVYLDTRFGQGSIQAITLMADIAELNMTQALRRRSHREHSTEPSRTSTLRKGSGAASRWTGS